MKKSRDTNYILEFITLGNSVKVTAIDPVTGREATIVGSTKHTEKQLSDLAIKKLKYVIEKKKFSGGNDDETEI